MHIYVFGSICTGEIDRNSDIDILSIVEGVNHIFDPNVYSIYSYQRIHQLWREGNPFAWHLAYESKLVFSSDGNDFLGSLGRPEEYKRCFEDCRKFYNLYLRAIDELNAASSSFVFEMSNIFLSVRNFSTCYALGKHGKTLFSRNSALKLGEKSVPISKSTYDLLVRTRILCTRATGVMPSQAEIKAALREIGAIGAWMNNLLKEVRNG